MQYSSSQMMVLGPELLRVIWVLVRNPNLRPHPEPLKQKFWGWAQQFMF